MVSPGTAAPVLLDFLDTAGSSCGALLPTGRACDEIDGLQVTCIDNGMPVALIAAKDLGKTGYESPADLEADSQLKSRVESIRLQAGALMNLGDVTTKTVPKMSLVAPAQQGGVIATRTFIPIGFMKQLECWVRLVLPLPVSCQALLLSK